MAKIEGKGKREERREEIGKREEYGHIFMLILSRIITMMG